MTDRSISTAAIRGCGTLIVKVSSNLLLPKGRGIDATPVVEQLANVRRYIDTIIVTSGAAPAGEWHLRTEHRRKKPDGMTDREWKKLCSGVGQPLVMNGYREAFDRHPPSPALAQLLLTEADLKAPQDLHALMGHIRDYLACDILPLINGNDPACAADLIPLDNDDLMCRIARLTHANVRIILTDTDGILDRRGNTIEDIPCDSTEWESEVDDTKSTNGTGGPKLKVRTAQDLVRKDGIPLHIANGWRPHSIEDILQEEKGPRDTWTTIRRP